MEGAFQAQRALQGRPLRATGTTWKEHFKCKEHCKEEHFQEEHGIEGALQACGTAREEHCKRSAREEQCKEAQCAKASKGRALRGGAHCEEVRIARCALRGKSIARRCAMTKL
eukprot:1158623-Pelagomonas_calceolata.AAC.8